MWSGAHGGKSMVRPTGEGGGDKVLVDFDVADAAVGAPEGNENVCS